MDCQHCEKILLEYIDGELAHALEEDVRQHLHTCQTCQTLHSELEQALTQVRRDMLTFEPSRAVDQRILAYAKESCQAPSHIDIEEPKRPWWQALFQVSSLQHAATFALLLLVVGSAFILQGREGTPQSDESARFSAKNIPAKRSFLLKGIKAKKKNSTPESLRFLSRRPAPKTLSQQTTPLQPGSPAPRSVALAKAPKPQKHEKKEVLDDVQLPPARLAPTRAYKRRLKSRIRRRYAAKKRRRRRRTRSRRRRTRHAGGQHRPRTTSTDAKPVPRPRASAGSKSIGAQRTKLRKERTQAARRFAPPPPPAATALPRKDAATGSAFGRSLGGVKVTKDAETDGKKEGGANTKGDMRQGNKRKKPPLHKRFHVLSLKRSGRLPADTDGKRPRGWRYPGEKSNTVAKQKSKKRKSTVDKYHEAPTPNAPAPKKMAPKPVVAKPSAPQEQDAPTKQTPTAEIQSSLFTQRISLFKQGQEALRRGKDAQARQYLDKYIKLSSKRQKINALENVLQLYKQAKRRSDAQRILQALIKANPSKRKEYLRRIKNLTP